GLLDLGQQVVVHKRTLFQRTSHLRVSLLLATRDDHVLRALVVTGAEALGQVAPWIDRVAPALALALAAAHRVVDRVHDDAAHRRADAHVALDAGLAELAQAVLL